MGDATIPQQPPGEALQHVCWLPPGAREDTDSGSRICLPLSSSSPAGLLCPVLLTRKGMGQRVQRRWQILTPGGQELCYKVPAQVPAAEPPAGAFSEKYGVSGTPGGMPQQPGEVTCDSSSQLANPPYKILTKDESSTSPQTLLTCLLEHQEESTEERQDPHGWESSAGSQLWGEEKGGRDEQEGPCLCVV